jgi:hypothetical protein
MSLNVVMEGVGCWVVVCTVVTPGGGVVGVVAGNQRERELGTHRLNRKGP